MDKQSNIYVTQPFMPPLDEFIPYLKIIWENKILTNGGPFHQDFEHLLCEYLGVDYISLFANGTLALVTALQALRINGEVITTPYSFVATAHALLWNNIKPVFVDIDPITLNLDPNKIEAAITPQTTAILPVHCYGTPCDIDALKEISEIYNIKIIYDGAHAFGVKKNGVSILKFGDLSVLSFHATKVFNTFEGGAIVSHNEETKKRIDRLKNFGIVDEITVAAPGINGKMSELNSAFGLLQLKYIDKIIKRRREIDSLYRRLLKNIKGIDFINTSEQVEANYSYFPILIRKDYRENRDSLYERLRIQGIYARRYFFPLISTLPMYRGLPSASPTNLSVANEAANQILCLPIYPDLADYQIEKIVDIIKE